MPPKKTKLVKTKLPALLQSYKLLGKKIERARKAEGLDPKTGQKLKPVKGATVSLRQGKDKKTKGKPKPKSFFPAKAKTKPIRRKRKAK